MRDYEPGPIGASARDDEPVSSGGSKGGPTELDWRVTIRDVYGGEFTHHIRPIPKVGSSGQLAEVNIDVFNFDLSYVL